MPGGAHKLCPRSLLLRRIFLSYPSTLSAKILRSTRYSMPPQPLDYSPPSRHSPFRMCTRRRCCCRNQARCGRSSEAKSFRRTPGLRQFSTQQASVGPVLTGSVPPQRGLRKCQLRYVGAPDSVAEQESLGHRIVPFQRVHWLGHCQGGPVSGCPKDLCHETIPVRVAAPYTPSMVAVGGRKPND